MQMTTKGSEKRLKAEYILSAFLSILTTADK
jgi:hypothetical protein